MQTPAKNRQMNIRFSQDDIAEIRRIAAREDREQSDLVRFFVRWSLMQYNVVFGSIHEMQKHDRLTMAKLLRGESEGELVEEAEKRLALMKAAAKKLEEEEGHERITDDERTTKTKTAKSAFR